MTLIERAIVSPHLLDDPPMLAAVVEGVRTNAMRRGAPADVELTIHDPECPGFDLDTGEPLPDVVRIDAEWRAGGSIRTGIPLAQLRRHLRVVAVYLGTRVLRRLRIIP